MPEGKVFHQVPNFNLIPLEYRRPSLSDRRFFIRLSLIVIIIAEIFLVANFYQQKLTLSAAINSTQQRLQQIENKLAVAKAKEGKAQELTTTIATLDKEQQTLDNGWRELGIKQTDWLQAMRALIQAKPQGILLSSVKLEGTRVSVSGTTTNYSLLLEYYQSLLTSPAISQIISLTSNKAGASFTFSLAADIRIGEK